MHDLRYADVFDKNPRAKAVLQIAAEQSGWGKPLPAGQGRSIALCIGFGSFIAQVVEVSVERQCEYDACVVRRRLRRASKS